MPSTQQAHRTVVGVGVSSALIGGALAVAPDEFARRVGLQDATGLRTIGLADLALVPGLLAGRRRWPWMLGRATVNVAIGTFLLRRPAGPDTARQRAACAALAAVTVQDLRVASALRAADA